MIRPPSSAELCNPLDVFRRPDPAADALAHRIAATTARALAALLTPSPKKDRL